MHKVVDNAIFPSSAQAWSVPTHASLLVAAQQLNCVRSVGRMGDPSAALPFHGFNNLSVLILRLSPVDSDKNGVIASLDILVVNHPFFLIEVKFDAAPGDTQHNFHPSCKAWKLLATTELYSLGPLCTKGARQDNKRCQPNTQQTISPLKARSQEKESPSPAMM